MNIYYEIRNETRNTLVSRVGDLDTAELYYEDCVMKRASQVFAIYEIRGTEKKKVR